MAKPTKRPANQKKTVLYFTVEDNFLTGFARGLWSEGEYRRAMDFLGTCGVNIVQAHRIIMGHLKFKEVGKTQEFILVKDNWKPNLNSCHLCQYPDPSNGMEMEEAEAKLAELKAELAFSVQLNKMLDEAGDNPKALRRIQNLALTHQLQKTYPMLRDEIYQDTRELIGSMGASDTAIEECIIDTKINDSVEKDLEAKAKPLPVAVYETGIILPNGEFYRCGALGHIRLALALGFGKEEGGDPEGLEPDGIAVREGCALVTASPMIKKIRCKNPTMEQQVVLDEWLIFVSYLNSRLYRLED